MNSHISHVSCKHEINNNQNQDTNVHVNALKESALAGYFK